MGILLSVELHCSDSGGDGGDGGGCTGPGGAGSARRASCRPPPPSTCCDSATAPRPAAPRFPSLPPPPPLADCSVAERRSKRPAGSPSLLQAHADCRGARDAGCLRRSGSATRTTASSSCRCRSCARSSRGGACRPTIYRARARVGGVGGGGGAHPHYRL